jgi:hypothetical protein
MAKIAFWITAGPDQPDKAMTGLRLAERLKNGKQQDVRVFLYGPGVRLATAGGALEEAVRTLSGSAIPVQVCPFNARSQEVAHELLLDQGVSLDETASEALVRWIEEGFQVIGV